MLKDMIEERTAARAGAITLAQAIETYQTFNRSERKSPRTIENYDHRLGKLCTAFGDGVLMSEFDEFMLRGHMASYTTNSQTGAPLKASTVNGHARALRAFFRWAYLNSVTEEHLLARYRPPKIPEEIIETLSDDEITALLAAASRRKRDLAVVTLMLDTGLRAAELCGISIDDVDVAGSSLKVMGKGRKERMVPFGRKTRKALIDYAIGERPGAAADRSLFLRSDGERLRTNGLRLLMRRLGKRSRIARLHPHLLRHTFATKFLLNGGDALMLKHILGHTTLAMTDRYVHFASAQGVTAGRAFSPIDRHEDGPAQGTVLPERGSVPRGWPGARGRF